MHEERVKVAYQICEQGNLHAGERRSLLCTEDDCKQRLICLICQHEQHKGHRTTFARKYLWEALPTIKEFAGRMNM